MPHCGDLERTASAGSQGQADAFWRSAEAGKEGLGWQGVSETLRNWSTYICNKCFEDNSARDKRVYLKPIKLIKIVSLLRERITQGMTWKNVICGVGHLLNDFSF